MIDPEKTNWTDIVSLMRTDISSLGLTPGNEARFLRRVTSTVEGLTAQHRRLWDINAHEWLAISTLYEQGRMTMTELGRRIPLSRAAVTTLTDRLERLGFVKRVPDPSDRRRILLEVLPKVEEELVRVMGAFDAKVQTALQARTADEREAIVSYLAEVRHIAREEADELALTPADELGVGGKPKRKAPPSLPDSW